jgi:hypothetical protein
LEYIPFTSQQMFTCATCVANLSESPEVLHA